MCPLDNADVQNARFYYLGGSLDPRSEVIMDAPEGAIYLYARPGNPLLLQKQSHQGGDPYDWTINQNGGGGGSLQNITVDPYPLVNGGQDLGIPGHAWGALYLRDMGTGISYRVEVIDGALSLFQLPVGPTIPVGAASNIKKKISAGLFSAKKPLALQPDGRVILADSDGLNTQNFIGYAMETSTMIGQMVDVQMVGSNIKDALLGMGFNTGDEIFISETGGYTNNVSVFTGSNDSIVKVGIADAPAGVTSSSGVDLIVFPDVLMRP